MHRRDWVNICGCNQWFETYPVLTLGRKEITGRIKFHRMFSGRRT